MGIDEGLHVWASIGARFAFFFSFLFMFRALREYLRVFGVVFISFVLSFSDVGMRSSVDITSIFLSVIAGIVVAAPTAVLFELSPLVGRILDTARGALLAEQLAHEDRVSTLEEALHLFSIACFFESGGGVRFVLRLITLSQELPELGTAAARAICVSASQVFLEAFELCAPLLFFVCVMEWSVGLIGRFYSRLSLQAESASIKLVASLFLLALALGLR